MDYLLVVAALILIVIVVMTGDKNEKGFNAMSRALLRALSVALFATSFAMAFGVVEVPTKYYGFVKLQHQLTYATVFGLGAVTLAILSVFTTSK
ncbi:hypothetical protein OMDBNIEC_00008 [Salmonella phage STP-SP5]|nr:hypothetical protein OMDBNIEC_00008 [Salmonella phage STP-SP5]